KLLEVRAMNKRVHDRAGEAGISILEYIIALVLVMIALIAWLELTATGVKNGTFVKRLGDVESLSSSKAAELARQANTLIKIIPNGQRKIGSIAPNAQIDGYSDLLDGYGNVIPESEQHKKIVKFVRQWL